MAFEGETQVMSLQRGDSRRKSHILELVERTHYRQGRFHS